MSSLYHFKYWHFDYSYLCLIYCQFVMDLRCLNKAHVTLHNDNDTITCIRALIGQKFIVIVRLKKKSLRWAILKSLSLSSNDNFIIFVVSFFCQLSRVYNLSYRYRCVVWPGLNACLFLGLLDEFFNGFEYLFEQSHFCNEIWTFNE